MMKKYTKKDLETFQRDEQGRLICPHGDYTEIKFFPARCCFAMGSTFGERSNFGQESTFGLMCVFGMESTFGMGSRFGGGSNFGGQSNFDTGCRFGKWSRFGELSRFGKGCSHEGLTNSIYVAVDRIGSELRKTYFFKAEEGYFVRAGCFFGTLNEFKTKLNKTHGGTIHEITYLMACNLAVKLLDSQWK